MNKNEKNLKEENISNHDSNSLHNKVIQKSLDSQISFDAIEDDFSLKSNSNVFVMGEMLDWDAPTGGFLLQGCFSTGFWVAKKLSKKHSE